MPGEYFPHPNFGRDASKAGETAIAEFDGEYGITLRMNADGHVVSVGPDPPGFVSEKPC